MSTPPPDAAKIGESPAGSCDLAAAERLTRRLTYGHYENFSVISLLLPRHLRQDFCNVYAYCRTADDLADEIGDADESLRQLGKFREKLLACYAGRSTDPVFIALQKTIQSHAIPISPFADLLDAFEQDQRVARYQTFAELVDYCRRSADPVGRLVLWMCGYRDAPRQRLSDQTCTALQLANFWQDVRRDLLDKNRVYLPLETMERFGLTVDQLRVQVQTGQCGDAAREMIRFETQRTAAMFDEGAKLLPLLDRSVRGQIGLFGEGGRAVLAAIRRQNYDTLSGRPRLSKLQKGRLIGSMLVKKVLLSRSAFASPLSAVEGNA